jgi:hypothetical protein
MISAADRSGHKGNHPKGEKFGGFRASLGERIEVDFLTFKAV